MHSPLGKGLPRIMPKSKKSTIVKHRLQKASKRVQQMSSNRKRSTESSLQTALVLSGAQSTRSSAVPRGLGSGLSSSQRRYLLALRSPFHPDALGVIVPDFPNRACQSFSVRWRAIVNIGNAANLTNVTFVPNPCLFGCYGTGGTPGSANVTWTIVEGTVSVVGSPGSPHGLPGAIVDAVNQTKPAFAANFSTFRVVAGGVRVSSLTPISVNQFVFNAYSMPAVQNNIPYSYVSGSATPAQPGTPYLFGSATLQQVVAAFVGGDVTTNSGSAALPSRRTYTGYEIQDAPLTLSFRPNNPIAHVFRETSGLPTLVGLGDFGDEVVVSTSGTPSMNQVTNSSDISNNEGWDGVSLSFWTNGSNSTSLQVEYILHCEGVPLPISSGLSPYTAPPPPFQKSSWSMDSLIGFARTATDFATSNPVIMNGMADALRAASYSTSAFNRSANNRLRLQLGEF